MAGMRQDNRTPVLFALILSMALVAMDTTIVATAIPQVVGDLGGFSQIGWVFSAYLLAQTVTIPIYGKLADLYGRKPILLFGIALFLLGSLLSALSWNMLALIGFRALQGLGAGSIGATVNTVAGDMYSVAERGRIQGYLSSVWGISAVIAPAVGGVFAEYVTWRAIFLVNLPLGALALGLIVKLLHEDVERRSHRIDYAGAALVLTASSLLILGLLQGGTAWAWSSPQSIAVFVGAAVAAGGVVIVEKRAAEPLMPVHLWARRLPAGSYAATLTAGMMVIGLSVYLPNWAQHVLGLNAVAAGFVLATMSVTWPTASGLSARLYMRIGFRNTALVGSAFAIASGVVFTLMPITAGVWQPVLGAALMGAGMGLIVSPLLVGLQNTVGWSERGTITGGAMFARFLGQSLGAAVFGAITNSVMAGRRESSIAVATNAAAHATFIGLLGAAVLTAAILLVLVPRHFPAYAAADPAADRAEPNP
ncbi:MAG: MFS transporter [Gordonia sp. (in: high G+C Gram-positive bacteria)]|uniref:MFS transporter n=1 Tax=Gordonia TaxID=2053 RepID=UPI003266188A